MPIHTPRIRPTRSRKHYLSLDVLTARKAQTKPVGGVPLSDMHGAQITRSQRRKSKLRRLGIAGQKS